MIDTTFFHSLAFYSGQFICHLKESIHISIGIFVKLFVNGKHTAFTQFLLHPEKKTACFQVETRLCLS